MPWEQFFIPFWTGSGLDRIFALGEEQTTLTCNIDMWVLLQGVSSISLQMIGGCMQINWYNKIHNLKKNIFLY